MNKLLEIIVNLKGNDALSPLLRNVMGISGGAQAKLHGLTKTLTAQKRELKELEKGFKAEKGNAHIYGLAMRDLEAKIQKTTDSMKRQRDMMNKRAQYEQMGRDMKDSGTRAMTRGVVIGAPLVMLARSAANFEDAMADARKVLNDWDTPALNQLNQQVLDLSGNIPIAAEGLAAIVAAGGQDGIGAIAAARGDFKAANNELIAFATASGKMSIAFNIAAEDAGDNMAKWRAGMGLTQTQAEALADKINALSDSQKGGKANEIADTITRVGSIGKIGGIASGEIAAMASLMSGIGVDSDRAATGIKNMMLALTTGSSATKSQQAVISRLGLNAENVAKQMQVDSKGTILDIFERLNKLPKFEQASQLETLFGREGVLAIAPMLSELDELKNKFNFVGNSANYAGSMTREFIIRSGTTTQQAQLAKNELNALAIDLGATLLPTIIAGAKYIKGITHSFREWSKAHPQLSAGILKAVGIIAMLNLGIGALKFGTGHLMGTMGQLIGLFGKYPNLGKGALKVFGLLRGGVLYLARGFMTAGAMMLANPMIAIIALIGVTIGIAAFWIYKNWAKIKKDFGDGLAYVKSLWTEFKAAGGHMLQGLIDGIMAKYNAVKNTITKMVDGIKSTFTGGMKIKSPSRVFVEYGKFISMGAAHGIGANSNLAIKAVRVMTAGIGAAAAIGAPAMAQGHLSANNARPSLFGTQSQARTGIIIDQRNMQITINAQPGQDEKAIAAAVRREIEDMTRKAQTRARSSYLGD